MMKPPDERHSAIAGPLPLTKGASLMNLQLFNIDKTVGYADVTS